VRLWLEQAFIELERGIAEIPGPQSSERIDAYLQTLERVRGRLLNLVDAALEEGDE